MASGVGIVVFIVAIFVLSGLKVLNEFEGSKAWRECQQDYVQRLNDENISDAAAGEGGGAPLAQ